MKAIIVREHSLVTCFVPNDMAKDYIEEYISNRCGFDVSKFPYHLLTDPIAENGEEDGIPVFKAGEHGTNIHI